MGQETCAELTYYMPVTSLSMQMQGIIKTVIVAHYVITTCRCGDLLLMTLLSELPITAAVAYNKTFECLVFTQSV